MKTINSGASKNMTAMLLITAFITGASVLAIELIGSRVLAPFFGSGIYTWSSLISVTLAALALGYAIGGRLVDKSPVPSILYGICLFAGIWTTATSWLAGLLLPVLVQLPDVRIGVLLSCCLLFFPNLFLLGTVGPFVIRLLSRDNTSLGSISGLVFSISTLGSLLAALMTGFFLIPTFSVHHILFFCGITLVALAAIGYSFLCIYRWGFFSLAILMAAFFAQSVSKETTNSELELLESKTSFYGQLHVVNKSGIKILLVDGIGQNYVTQNKTHLTSYINFMALLPQLLQKPENNFERSLVIGLGAGQLPMLLKQMGLDVDVVEIDPLIVVMAKKHFDFTMQDKHIHITDGRLYLTRSTEKYEYIFIDAFNADQIAWHLLSKEALQITRQHMTDHGLLAINLTSTVSGQDIASLQYTLQAVFPYVRGYSDNPDAELSSIVFVAATSPIHLSSDSPLLDTSHTEHAQQFLAGELGKLSDGILLTDDFNPISQQRQQVQLLWRKKMRDFLGEKQLQWLFL